MYAVEKHRVTACKAPVCTRKTRLPRLHLESMAGLP